MLGEFLWPWILTPLCARGRRVHPPPARQPRGGGHQLHVGAWIVLESLERHRARDTLVQSSKASIPAVPQEPPPLQLSLSLLPALAANGDGHGRAAARASGCHAGIVLGVGSHGARALGKGVTARQHPAILTGHCHLTGGELITHEPAKGLPVPDGPTVQGDVTALTQLHGVSHYRWGQQRRLGLAQHTQKPSGWQRDRQRQRHQRSRGAWPIPTFSSCSRATCSFSRHSRLAVGQHKACATASLPLAQRLGPLPSPTTGLPPAPSTTDGEWKLHPARGRGDIGTGRPRQHPSAHNWCQGCPERALNLPPSTHTAHAPLPCVTPTTHPPSTPNPRAFLEETPLSFRLKGL